MRSAIKQLSDMIGLSPIKGTLDLTKLDSELKVTLASLATKMEWKLFSGEPNKMKVARAIKGMKLVTMSSGMRSGMIAALAVLSGWP